MEQLIIAGKNNAMTNSPIFVTGTYRSGTTLVTRMLNNHPDLWVTFDSVHFLRHYFDRYNPIEDLENVHSLLIAAKGQILSRLDLDIKPTELIDSMIRKYGLGRLSYGHIYDDLMRSLAVQQKPRFQRWGEKTVLSWLAIPSFLSMFNGGKVITVYRDPRDVMSSFKKLTTAPAPGYLNTAFVALDCFNSIQLNERRFSPKNFMTVNYESLVRNPKEVCMSVCDFIELDFVPEMLDVNVFKDKTGRSRWNGNSAFHGDFTEITAKGIGNWEKELTRWEVGFLERIAGEKMREFGYLTRDLKLDSTERAMLDEAIVQPCIRDKFEWWRETGRGFQGFSTEKFSPEMSTPVI
ncbi:MAG: sulfotransferase [Chromatiaceae bacterium]|nr:sulfotransferase [Chromatiaceae bacterium]